MSSGCPTKATQSGREGKFHINKYEFIDMIEIPAETGYANAPSVVLFRIPRDNQGRPLESATVALR